MSNQNKNFYRLQDQKVFIGAGNLDQKLSPGCYQMKMCEQTGNTYIEQISGAAIDKTSYTPQMNEIVGVVKTFAKNVVLGNFKKHSYKSKFGVLLEGPPGTGKSQTVNVSSNAFVDAGGIVVFIVDDRVYRGGSAGNYLKKLNAIQPDLPLMVILEDLDSIPPHYEVFLTSILDGEQSPSNTFFLGTTNFLETLSPRIKRPGRFDIIYKVDGLSDVLRRQYIVDKLVEFSLPSTEEKVNELYDLTKGYNFSEIRTYMSYFCFFGFEAHSLAAKITRLSSITEPEEKLDGDEMESQDRYDGGDDEDN